MTELAHLPYDTSCTIDWSNCRVPAREIAMAGVSRLKLRGLESGVAKRPKLPGPGVRALHGSDDVWCIGPSEWLIFGSNAIRGIPPAALIPVDDQLTLLGLGAAAPLVAMLSGLPESAIAPGRVASTRLAGMHVRLGGMADGSVRLAFNRMFARHMHAWLDCAI